MLHKNYILTLLIITLLFVSCSNSAKDDEKKIDIGKYKGKTLYINKKNTDEILETVEKSMLDYEKFKKRESKKYEEILQNEMKKYYYQKKVLNKIDDFKEEFLSHAKYRYDLQHIFLHDKGALSEVMMFKNKLNSFKGFAELAKKYSKEEGTSKSKGLLTHVKIYSNDISTKAFYNLKNKPLKEPFSFKDDFGYHVFRIIKKIKLNVDENKDRFIKIGTNDFIKYKLFKKLYKKYNVKIFYSNLYRFLEKDKNTEVYSINGNIVQKNEFINKIPEKLGKDIYFKARINLTSAAPLVSEIIKDELVTKEIEKIQPTKEIIKKANNRFKEVIYNKWFDTLYENVDISDITDEKITKLYNQEKDKIPMVERVKIDYIVFNDKNIYLQAKKRINNYQDYLKYQKQFPGKIRTTSFFDKNNIPSDYSVFEEYLKLDKKTLLPGMKFRDKWIIPIIKDKITEKKVNLLNYKNRIKSLAKQVRFYEKVLEYWKSVDELKLKEWVYEDLEKFIEKMRTISIDKIKNIK